MLSTAYWNIEVFVEQDDSGALHAEAMLLTEGVEPFFARGTCCGTASGECSAGAAATVAADALLDLAHVLSRTSPVTSRRPRSKVA